MKQKTPKKPYGEFGNIMLTDEEREKLRERFRDSDYRIDSASIYLEARGDKYKSHYAMILNWARMDAERKREGGRREPIDY